jgi:hypothetical protein
MDAVLLPILNKVVWYDYYYHYWPKILCLIDFGASEDEMMETELNHRRLMVVRL